MDAPARLVDAAIKQPEAQALKHDDAVPPVTPYPNPVEGSSLLKELSEWFGSYMYMEQFRLDTVALWVVVTWFREEIDRFVPILTVISPTSGCGKSNLLTLLAARGESRG